MTEQLSSSDTTFFKRVLPPILTVGTVLLIAGMSTNPRGFFSNPPLVSTLAVTACALSWWWSRRLADVQLEGDMLVISKGSQTIRVPVTEIERVYQNVLLNVRPVTIRFKQRTSLGRSIDFIAPLTFGVRGPSDLLRRLRLMSKGMTPV